MGIETVIFAALAGLQAVSKMSAAESAAKATIKKGEIDASQSALKTRYAAAKQTASFLASGITLEGTPMDVVNETFKTGKEDVANIRDNANATAKNQISTGRSQAIDSIMGSFKGADIMGSAGSMFDTGLSYLPESASYGLNNMGFGNDAFNALEMKDMRAGISD